MPIPESVLVTLERAGARHYLAALLDLHGSFGVRMDARGGLSFKLRIGLPHAKLRTRVAETFGGAIDRRAVCWYGPTGRRIVAAALPHLIVRHTVACEWLAFARSTGGRGARVSGGTLSDASLSLRRARVLHVRDLNRRAAAQDSE